MLFRSDEPWNDGGAPAVANLRVRSGERADLCIRPGSDNTFARHGNRLRARTSGILRVDDGIQEYGISLQGGSPEALGI